jgi:mannose-6-phosphate isomerase-like protein (cupin superfamily)
LNRGKSGILFSVSYHDEAEMEIFNKDNTRNTGSLEILKSYMLIGSRNVKDAGISIQISYIPVNSGQPIHSHEPEQCYYIISGNGLMSIDNDEEYVNAGDAVHIPSGKKHGIRNVGTDALQYLTANSPAFSEEYESRLWPEK